MTGEMKNRKPSNHLYFHKKIKKSVPRSDPIFFNSKVGKLDNNNLKHASLSCILSWGIKSWTDSEESAGKVLISRKCINAISYVIKGSQPSFISKDSPLILTAVLYLY
jgi:hypothetical protein